MRRMVSRSFTRWRERDEGKEGEGRRKDPAEEEMKVRKEMKVRRERGLERDRVQV